MRPHHKFWPPRLPHAITPPATSLWQNLAISALRYPDKPATVFFGAVLTWAQLKAAAERLAARLQALGVVNQVCEPGEALSQALALAERLNARAPNTLASIKELVNDAQTTPLHTQLAAERDHFVRNLHHPNAGEGIAAFLGKRKPDYR